MTIQQENYSEKIILSKSDKKFIKEWEDTRAKGFWKYALVEGLGFGIPMFFVNVWVLGLYKNWMDILLNLAILPFVGLGYASMMWAFHNWNYKNILKKSENNQIENN